MIRGGHSPARAMRLSDGPVLVECRRTDNGWFVYAFVQVNIVNRPIGSDGAFVRATSGGIIGAEVFSNVVFDERVL